VVVQAPGARSYLGCGPIYFTLPMAEMRGGGRVIAVDAWMEM
jgi:hypothetical protein